MTRAHVLVVDDEPGIRSGVRDILTFEGFGVSVADSGRTALSLVEKGTCDIVFIDYRLPDIDGLTLLQSIRQMCPEAMTCMITAYANIETAIAATRQGVDFFLPKPFSSEDLLGVVENLLRTKQMRDEAGRLREAHAASLRELASEKSQTHSLVASLRDGVLVVNRDAEIVLVNHAMAGLLGVQEEYLIGRPVQPALEEGPLAPALSSLDPSSPGPAVFEIDLEPRRMLVTVSGFRDDAGSLLGQILTVVDISAVRRMALEKARFTRTLVHELRAPLSAVKSILEVMHDKSLGDELDSYQTFVRRAGERIDGLSDLISDLLSLSRIDQEGTASVPVSHVDPGPEILETVELWRDRASSAEVRLEVDFPSGLPTVAMARDDLRTVVSNLVGNAIKYNKAGGTVTVRAKHGAEGLVISVRDTGIGIDAENLPRLMDEFFREKRQETRHIEGNGLGLSIVKRLVDRAGGRLRVESELGVGSVFRLELPC